jgi:hypothetical protein
MKISRFSVLCLGSLWFAACATAQDGSSPGDSDDSSGGSGAVSSGGAIGGSGTNGAFGGAAGIPGSGGSTSAGTSGTDGGASGSSAGGLANGGASGSSTGGTAGTGGSGGAGPSVPAFVAGECAANPTVSLQYLDGSSNPKQITGQYQFINTSATPIPLSELQIYYFYTNEETSGWNLHVYSSQLDGGTGGYRDLTSATTFTIGPLSPALNDADSYTQIAFTGTQSNSPWPWRHFRWIVCP